MAEETRDLVLQIDGMHCASCAQTVEKALKDRGDISEKDLYQSKKRG